MMWYNNLLIFVGETDLQSVITLQHFHVIYTLRHYDKTNFTSNII